VIAKGAKGRGLGVITPSSLPLVLSVMKEEKTFVEFRGEIL